MAITPRHYLDFIHHFVKLYGEKRSDLEEQQLHLNVGLNKIAETVEQVEEMQKSLAVKSQELHMKNEAANAKLKQMFKDQQEAEKKKVQSQEIQLQLAEQTIKIEAKRKDVMADLAQVEPAVIDAQTGKRTRPFSRFCSFAKHFPRLISCKWHQKEAAGRGALNGEPSGARQIGLRVNLSPAG